MKTTLTRRIAPFGLAAGTLLSAGFSIPARAQSPRNDLAVRTQKRVATLIQTAGKSARNLRLSGAQKTRLQSITRKNAPLLKAIWSDNSLSPSQKMRGIRALQNEAGAVFTPAQKQKLAVAKSEAMLQLFRTASWVSGELSLSDDQQQQIQRIVMKSYRGSSSAAGSFGALRALITDTNSQIDATLTPPQKMKWNIIKRVARSEFVKNARAWQEIKGV